MIRAGAAHYTNRIHRDDCVGVLRHLMQLEAPEPLYLGVDCEPADEAAVLRWLAGVLGAPEPRVAAAGAPVGRKSRGSQRSAQRAEGERGPTGKRCRNDRLLASGYRFLYPSFRDGYRVILADPA